MGDCGQNYDALAIASGMLCDGAKASCAAKIAESIDAAVLGYNIFANGEEFGEGDGILNHDIDSFIGAVLFTASDIVLIFNTFSGGEPKFSMRITNLSLYYIGQVLIASSLFFLA